MNAVIAIWSRLVQAVVALYRSGLSTPDTFAPPPRDPPEPGEPADEDPAR